MKKFKLLIIFIFSIATHVTPCQAMFKKVAKTVFVSPILYTTFVACKAEGNEYKFKKLIRQDKDKVCDFAIEHLSKIDSLDDRELLIIKMLKEARSTPEQKLLDLIHETIEPGLNKAHDVLKIGKTKLEEILKDLTKRKK